jgi:hypothetical protein
MYFSYAMLFSIHEMWLQNFQVLELVKLYNLFSNINKELFFLNLEWNLDNMAVEKIILKCKDAFRLGHSAAT